MPQLRRRPAAADAPHGSGISTTEHYDCQNEGTSYLIADIPCDTTEGSLRGAHGLVQIALGRRRWAVGHGIAAC